MGYVKVVKNKNYFKRYRVKLRRRRENKTDYRIRRRLIQNDKRKFNAPKWRLVVRITNKDVIAQVVSAKVNGDDIISAAYSHELKRYGLRVGLTNYSACYCTGLLIARRVLNKVGLDAVYKGKKTLDGKGFLSRATNVKWQSGQSIARPFKCILDTGLHRCTTGARVFAVLKGAVDGGLNIPHSPRRFPGFKKGKGKEKNEYDHEKHRNRIFGANIAKYMRKLEEKNPEKYNKQFSVYIKEGVTADSLEDLYDSVHRAIRKDPTPAPKQKREVSKEQKEKSKKRAKMSRADKNEALKALVKARLDKSKAKDEDGDVAITDTVA